MQTMSQIVVSCLLCLSLTFMSGCGGGVPKLTPAEQTEVDKIMAKHGKNAIIGYLNELMEQKWAQMRSMEECHERMFSDTEEKNYPQVSQILRFCRGKC